MNELSVRIVPALLEVDPLAWDALVGHDDPFVEHGFLTSLETSGSVGRRAGWTPQHLTVYDRDDRLVGAAPMYVKAHSYGEYIFDWAWANAAHRAGLSYYPKLVSMVPVTPATGSRLLVLPGVPRAPVVSALVQGARELAQQVGASGLHWLFVTEEDQHQLTAHGFHPRLSYQFHWTRRPHWTDFSSFLADLTSRRRKEVRRERAQAAGTGLTLTTEPLTALSSDDLDLLHRCYRNTIDEHGGTPYLTEVWFQRLARDLGHRGVAATARRDGVLVAASLAFHKGRNLYGRYWGTLDPSPALHFELCYHQLIAWALDHGIQRFEAGAQGLHKLPRGLMPSLTYSSHRLQHPGLDAAVADFLGQEAEHVQADVASLSEQGPFRCEADDQGR